MSELTQARLKELLHYDPETGIFTNRVQRRRISGVGERAGYRDGESGYRSICIDVHRYYEHRLAFLYMTGAWPAKHVDHLDGQRGDNRWTNLRDVARVVNQQNMRRAPVNNASGLLGAHRKRNRWSSQIKVHGRLVKLGIFDTALQAHHAYIAAKRRFHEGCTL